VFDTDDELHVIPICNPQPAVPWPVVSIVPANPPIGTAGRIVPDGTSYTANPKPLPVPASLFGGDVQITMSNCA
jgi:hypothetical protein